MEAGAANAADFLRICAVDVRADAEERLR